jgi:hypothetical protein
MKHAIWVILVLVGLINAIPVTGVLGAEALARLYGLPIDEPNLLVLMRHRAVLLGLVGGYMIVAAFRPALRPSAFVLGFASMLSFIALAYGVGGINAAVERVALIDVGASVLLIAAAVLHTRSAAQAST